MRTSGLLARMVHEGRQRQGANRLLWQSRGRSSLLPGRSTDHRVDIFTLFWKNLHFENQSDVSPHANATVYALRDTKFYTDQVHWPLLIVRLSTLLIQSISSTNTCWPTENKTYILPLPSLDPQSMVISLKKLYCYLWSNPAFLFLQELLVHNQFSLITKTPLRGLDDSQSPPFW
jgi:hypothetical protein